jgi:hypothetical protein
LAIGFIAKHGDIDLSYTQICANLDSGHGDKTQPRIPGIVLDELADFFVQKFGNLPLASTGHKPN